MFFSYFIFLKYLALKARLFFAYLEFENITIKLSSYNYKYYQSKRKIEVERQSSYLGYNHYILQKLRARF